jgi:hypothetical protein
LRINSSRAGSKVVDSAYPLLQRKYPCPLSPSPRSTYSIHASSILTASSRATHHHDDGLRITTVTNPTYHLPSWLEALPPTDVLEAWPDSQASCYPPSCYCSETLCSEHRGRCRVLGLGPGTWLLVAVDIQHTSGSRPRETCSRGGYLYSFYVFCVCIRLICYSVMPDLVRSTRVFDRAWL